MVSSGSGQVPTKPSQGVLFLLERSGLMAGHGFVSRMSYLTNVTHFPPANSGRLQITALGFQFLPAV